VASCFDGLDLTKVTLQHVEIQIRPSWRQCEAGWTFSRMGLDNDHIAFRGIKCQNFQQSSMETKAHQRRTNPLHGGCLPFVVERAPPAIDQADYLAHILAVPFRIVA
jgi:hypothetical protein